jgi:hypothetical protein
MRVASRKPEVADLNTVAAATYLGEMCASLADIARHHGMETLGYLLDMAREEAENNARPPDGDRS